MFSVNAKMDFTTMIQSMLVLISTSVQRMQTSATKMLIVTMNWVVTAVIVTQDSMEMDLLVCHKLYRKQANKHIQVQ